MLKIEYVYILNMIIGFMNAFQSPAESVVIGLLIPKDKLKQASGLDSSSSNLITIVSPMLATALVSIWNIGIVVVFDLLTFAFAIFSLIFMVHVTEDIEVTEESGAFRGFKEGLSFLQKHKEIWCIIITMSFINFFSRLTYENILSPMILARSGGSEISLGNVNPSYRRSWYHRGNICYGTHKKDRCCFYDLYSHDFFFFLRRFINGDWK